MSTKETKLQKIAQERSPAVLRTLMAIESEATVELCQHWPNSIFWKQEQMRRMDELGSLGTWKDGKTIGHFVTTTKNDRFCTASNVERFGATFHRDCDCGGNRKQHVQNRHKFHNIYTIMNGVIRDTNTTTATNGSTDFRSSILSWLY